MRGPETMNKHKPGRAGDWLLVLIPLAAVFGPVAVIYLLALACGW